MGNNKGSIISKLALKIIDGIRQQIVNGDCDDDLLMEAISDVKNHQEGYINENDYVNYDEALKILGLGYNRARLNELCKENGIESKKINNVKIGFNKKEILKLKYKIQK